MARPRSPDKRPQFPRSLVDELRHRRIIGAFAFVCSDRGYCEVTIEEVAAAAWMPHSTVYEQFANKEAILLATLDRAREELRKRVEEACLGSEGEDWAQVDAALASVLHWIAEDPPRAQVFLHEFESDGTAAHQMQRKAIEWFTGALRRCVPVDHERPSQLEEMLVAGIVSLLRFRVLAGRAVDLPALRPELTSLLCHTYR